MSESSSIKEQLAHLKVLTERTGVVHDAQVFQLKMWAQVAFGKDTLLDLDTARKNIDYYIKSEYGFNLENIKFIEFQLTYNAEQLLGKGWKVKVFIDDEKFECLNTTPNT